MQNDALPDWEELLSSAARLQRIYPDAVLVGGTAAALHAGHRLSRDADHILPGLSDRFEDVLSHLEDVAGWKTARVRRPVLILGNLDGIETGIRQLIRKEPLETTKIVYGRLSLTVPTEAEMLRIKGVLILKRNATRDYLDFVALTDHLGDKEVSDAMRSMDRLYPQENDQSVTQQLSVQLANPLPYDLEGLRLAEYKNLDPRWHDWNTVKAVCGRIGVLLLELL